MLHRIQELAQQGAIITGPEPVAPIGYMEQQTKSAEFKALSDQIWGAENAPFNQVGKGRIYRKTEWAKLFADNNVAPDFAALDAGQTLFIHRQSDTGDIYFVVNDEETPRTLKASFRVTDRIPELWHADTGEVEKLAQFVQENGRTDVEIPLPAHGSAFAVFRQNAAGLNAATRLQSPAPDAELVYDDANQMRLHTRQNGTYQITLKSGAVQNLNVNNLPAPLPINGAWQVNFEGDAVKEPHTLTFDSLTDWKDNARDDIKHFSGSATYSKIIDLPANWKADGNRTYLDLGQVEIAAEVKVNGQTLPTLWKAPFVVNVTDALKAGPNQIEIRVTNLWTNRLIGDNALPDKSGYKPTDEKMPAWYLNNEPLPAGPRSTFTTFDFYGNGRDKTLLPSGLLGPVSLFQESDVAAK